MTDRLVLTDGVVSAIVRPEFGAGLARLDVLVDGRQVPLLRPEPPGGAQRPFELGMQILLPWSNRISSGGFSFRGRRYELPPNVEGEPFPIHGNGFSQPWSVTAVGASSASLRLESIGPGPYRYRADLVYAVGDGALTITLELRNTGDDALPFGFGLHPWFPRTAATELQARAAGVWLETDQHLPSGTAPVAVPPEWDFSTAIRLPAGFVNNAFTGWDGRAGIHWPDRGLQLAIEASPSLATYVLYSPSAQSDFFCFEPVSHPVDAFNLPGPPASHGLAVLEPGEATSASAKLSAARHPG
jgi:aldose 1-epimerase